MFPSKIVLAAATSVLLSLCGCNLIGPTAVRQARLPYNEAMSRSWSEQLLLNLVRLKYRDPPFFLETNSLSTQYSLSSSLGAAQRVDWNSPGGDTFAANVGVDYSERPTVTYTPLQGESFSRRLLTPIPLQYIFLMTHSGWGVDRVMRCCVQGINDIFNAANAAGPTPAAAPSFERFSRVARLLGDLQQKGGLRLGRESEAESEAESGSTERHEVRHLLLQMRSGKETQEQTKELKGLLGLDPNQERFHFSEDAIARDHDEIVILTRSLLATMFYLSQSVEIPEDDAAKGKVTQTITASGEAFDWHRLHEGLFQVRSAAKPPTEAFVAVPYRGSWFYIDDADLESKSTFVLLSFLFSLQAGEVRSLGPQLTLPLGG